MHLPAPSQRQAIQSPIHEKASSPCGRISCRTELARQDLYTVLVGFAHRDGAIRRICLGVHWPTDVVAGWIAGATWATLCLLVSRRIVFTNRFLDKWANAASDNLDLSATIQPGKPLQICRVLVALESESVGVIGQIGAGYMGREQLTSGTSRHDPEP